MAFADIEDLGLFLSANLDAGSAAQAQLILEVVTAEMQGYMNQKIELVEDDEITLDAPGGCVLLLPELPVTEVSEISVDGTAVNDLTTDLTLGAVYRSGDWVSRNYQAITVTYSHGYESIPADIKGVCLSLAARLLEGKSGYTVDTEGNPAVASTVFRAGIVGNFTDEERAVMDRYRLIPVA